MILFVLNEMQILMNEHDSALIILKYIFCCIALFYFIIEFKHKNRTKMWIRTNCLYQKSNIITSITFDLEDKSI